MKSAITIFLTIASMTINAQSYFRNSIELNIDYGISGNSHDASTYDYQFNADQILVNEKTTVRSRNYQVGITRFLNAKSGIKASFGYANYGFNLEGNFDLLGTRFDNSYTISYLEWGISYIRRIPFKLGHFLFEPGLRYHSDGSPRSSGIYISRKDALSFSFYSGYELPMVGNNFFTNLGLQIKVPVESYSSELSDSPSFYPYFIGLKLGVNFQFQRSNQELE